MNVHDEIIIPGQEARCGETPSWLAGSPVWPAVHAQTDGGQLYRHQAMGLELLEKGHNLVISTGTASGKSLVFQAPTLHHLATHPNATGIAIYPIKALARTRSSAAGTWRRQRAWTPPTSTGSTATSATSPNGGRSSSAPAWP